MYDIDRLMNVAALISAALILTILFSLRRSHIRVEYSGSWLAAGLAMLALSRWPEALHRAGALLGISYPPAVLLAASIGLFFIVLYRNSMMISALKDNNIALAQKVAILEYQLNTLRDGK